MAEEHHLELPHENEARWKIVTETLLCGNIHNLDDWNSALQKLNPSAAFRFFSEYLPTAHEYAENGGITAEVFSSEVR